MNAVSGPQSPSDQLVDELNAYIERCVNRNHGSSVAIRPTHRIKFHWPPHPVSYSYHVLASDWTGRTILEAHGEEFVVEVARTANGVFGRAPALWHEERGETEQEMLEKLRAGCEPLFQRQRVIAATLERAGRFTGHIRDLRPIDLMKLLYCENRDVANEARSEIETNASTHLYLPALLSVLDDRRHPHRRSAQWCVLDLFEDLPSFCLTPEEASAAIESIKGLIWDAEDDYARTIYKAGVVLGGHIPYVNGGPALIECFKAPSRIGRRSAIHASFHLVEWTPDARGMVVEALKEVEVNDSEPILRQYAALMARDILNGDYEHTPDVFFPDEV